MGNVLDPLASMVSCFLLSLVTGLLLTLPVQVPALNIFESSLKRGKFDQSRKLSDGSMLDFAHIFPMDAVYDKPEDVPEDVRTSIKNWHNV